MTKSELKTGMIVITRNGDEYMVLKDAHTELSNGLDILACINKGGYLFLSSFNDNLTEKFGNEEFDIMEIHILYSNSNLLHFNGIKNRIWERKEKRRYTYAQLREILGEEFEVVG